MNKFEISRLIKKYLQRLNPVAKKTKPPFCAKPHKSANYSIHSILAMIVISVIGAITGSALCLLISTKTNIDTSNIGDYNILLAYENSPNSEGTIIRKLNKEPFEDFSRAIARLDFETIKKFSIKTDQIQFIYQTAFSMLINGKDSVANEFFRRAKKEPLAIEWLKALIKSGFDVNTIIKNEKQSTSLFWVAVDERAIDAAVFLLEIGASPHSWDKINNTRDYYQRMIWPIEYILNNDYFSAQQKRKLINALKKLDASIIGDHDNLWLLKDIGLTATPVKSNFYQTCPYGKDRCESVSRLDKIYITSDYGINSNSPDIYYFGVDGSLYIKGQNLCQEDTYIPYPIYAISINIKSERAAFIAKEFEACGQYKSCWKETLIDPTLRSASVKSTPARQCKPNPIYIVD